MLNWSHTRMATIVVCTTLVIGAGCSPQHYKSSADREVYTILEAKRADVSGMPEGFTIEQPEQDLLEACPVAEPGDLAVAIETDAEEAIEEAPPGELPVVISLETALEIATLNSREYQTQKEWLYQSALSLTFQHYQFRPHFLGTLSGDYENTDMGDDEKVTGSTRFGFSWLLKTGARVSVALTSTLSEFLTHDPRKAASSIFNITITQPLLKGAGIAVAEPLTQAERDVLYQIRAFVRFRRTFFLRVLSDYYRVLQQRRIMENERVNYQNLKLTRDWAEWLSEAGRMAEFQVDQIRQQELSAENGFVFARQGYENQLDGFKITLGLPTRRPVILDPKELARLGAEEATDIALPLSRIESIATEHRLDLMTQKDRVEDAQRKVKVARNDLLPGVDLTASLTTDTEGTTQPLNFQGDRTDLGAGLEIDLPLDKLSERNEYRRRLIAYARAQRDHQNLQDGVIREVRDAWREYASARRSYEIQSESVALAERRVESTMLLLEAGRADARDVLDAHAALLRAQNALARDLVNYKVARLQLARDMGILVVGDKGELEEHFDEYE